ncbi:MAG: hypothetical protein WC254_03215 [Candidatus Woesearchaeota archaeon]|jgi:hypothetical protein
MKQLLKKPIIKNILFALAILMFGYILLILTFIFDTIYQGIIRNIAGSFLNLSPDSTLYWFSPVMHGSFVLIIWLISWFIFKSKLKKIYKAIYLVIPTAVVLVTLGMFLYHWPILVYTIGSLFCGSTLYYFYKTNQPWIYYYAVILVSITLAIFTVIGGEI